MKAFSISNTIVYCAISFFLVSGCREDAKKPVVPQALVQQVQLETFDTMPGSIDGCGEYYTYDTSAFTNANLVFVSDMQDLAFIRIKGKDIELHAVRAPVEETGDKKYVSVYEGNGYKAVLSVEQTKVYDEGGYYKGTLQISYGGQTYIYKVHGETGC
jgi:hypothetical protein